jgi:acetylornithine deacetylase/succinyl-diaminopimelate desuccinylase-like protein
MIFEGDEETSSGDVEKHVLLLKERIGNPKLIFCLDSGTNDYDRLWVTTSLRGYVIATIRVEVLKEGVHSGIASGLVPSSFRILQSLLERLEDTQTGYMNKSLDVDIPPNRYKEIYDLAKHKGEGALKTF